MAEDIARAFVCGHPVAHSRSPLIHGHWLASLGIRGSYEAIDVAPDDFADFLRGIASAGFTGGNVTIPHKEAAFAAVDGSDEASEMIGAINTVWIADGRLLATNTDWSGFSANLDEGAPAWVSGRRAVVLGAGGSARAILFALLRKGYREVRVVNRTVDRARELADRFGGRVSAHDWVALPELLADCDLLVNTTPIGMAGRDGSTPPDLALLPGAAIVTDIVYVPLLTPLLVAARARGLKTVDGLGMLLHQAVPGFARWFGQVPEVTAELRALVIADMERHR
ncbi:shikimate dehydrogenase [Aquibium carbonis]|uniref:Shikimate dehydrogenase (NADP(+)) n=1 Tax=Aquibium carbonis TaxID=2495581 RepID=A0A3S0AA52_9HYPH|nr:shikimate dehydrogenase [Aquibium carbonis]RST88135.1 shikimate dehydrogenase [Aquibium carbonis]